MPTFHQHVDFRKSVVGKIGVYPVQQDVQLVQIPQDLVLCLSRLKDRNVRIVSLQIGVNLLCFFRNHGDADSVRVMFGQAVQHAFIVVPDVRLFEAVAFPVFDLVKSVQDLFPVGNKQKFVHPQKTSIGGFPRRRILYPVTGEYATFRQHFVKNQAVFFRISNPGTSVISSTMKTMISA